MSSYYAFHKLLDLNLALYLLLSLLPAGVLTSTFLGAPKMVDEICDNALDDDEDGLIDLNDPDCECPVLEPISLIPNPSFEEMQCCPSNRSQLNCAETWIQASEATTDYIHTCGWMGWDDFPPPQPFPDGDGIIGFRDGRVFMNSVEAGWKEYTGACLLSPLRANVAYRFEFYLGFVNSQSSPPINISFFGTTDCENLPFGIGNDYFGCPTNGDGWVKLGSERINGRTGWVPASIEVTPTEDIYGIAIGPDCPDVNASVSTYYFFDNLILAEQRAFEFKISEVRHPCTSNFTLKVPESSAHTYQWYKDGIALLGETSAQLSAAKEEGNYRVRIIGPDECKITQIYTHRVPVIEEYRQVSICEGEDYQLGTRALSTTGLHRDTFISVDLCDSIVTVQLNVIGRIRDTVSARIFEGESYPVGTRHFKEEGEHNATLVSSLGCDSLVTLNLDFYKVYFPNAFSPNNDGINDTFNVFGQSDLIDLQSLKIFDRWGALLYDGQNILPNSSTGWDGQFRSKPLENGVYTYIAILLMEDGITRQVSGAVTLIR